MENWQTIAWTGALHHQAALVLIDGRRDLVRDDGTPSNLPAAANSVAMVNLALSVELLLKALVAQSKGTPPRGHDLANLWGQIDPATQTKVEKLCASPVSKICTTHNGSFENWRYHWEDPTLSGTPAELDALGSALREVAGVGVGPVNAALAAGASPLAVGFDLVDPRKE